ncbi:MAG: transporter substrate-binding domain-containing protein [Alphaproteobacteria bacterium]|jgi:polar amino acid transport system substrate-binding protein
MQRRKLVLAGTAAVLAAGLLAAPAQAETIRIATEGAYPPFNMKDKAGNLTGFDVDIAKALCAEMKAKCVIVAQDWDGIIPGLLAKKYDAIVASMSITKERMKKVAFTAPYYKNYLRFVARKGKKLMVDKAGLKGKIVGAQRQTVSSKHLETAYKGVVKIKVYGTQQAAWLDLKAGRTDAVLADIYPGHDWISKNKRFAFVGKKIDINDQIGIAVRKEDSALRDKLSAAIKAIRANGTYAKINAKYFPFDIYQ